MDDELSDRIDHVIRVRLPWRTTDLTECGRDAARFPSITADDYVARRNKYGARRTAFTVCGTCEARLDWSLRRRRANNDGVTLVEALGREIDRVRYDTDSKLAQELAAIAALIAMHRSDYDQLLDGLGDVANLDQVRAAKRKARR